MLLSKVETLSMAHQIRDAIHEGQRERLVIATLARNRLNWWPYFTVADEVAFVLEHLVKLQPTEEHGQGWYALFGDSRTRSAVAIQAVWDAISADSATWCDIATKSSEESRQETNHGDGLAQTLMAFGARLREIAQEKLDLGHPPAAIMEDIAGRVEAATTDRKMVGESTMPTTATAMLSVSIAAQCILSVLVEGMPATQREEWAKWEHFMQETDLMVLRRIPAKFHELYRFNRFEDRIRIIEWRWWQRAYAHGDGGSCVVGAGFEFRGPNGQRYEGRDMFRAPMEWQGSFSWEHCREDVARWLEAAGAQNIRYRCGWMD